MLKELIRSWNEYCKEENFIGIGSTRKVYRVMDYVIKLHLHPLGYKQSKNEFEIYNTMIGKGISGLFAQTYYVDKDFSIQKYYEPIKLINGQSYEIHMEKHAILIPNLYEEALNRYGI